jgi:NTE family protein
MCCVLLTSLRRDDTPRTVKEIDERITELSFNATFMREMQTFARAAEFSDLSPAASGTSNRSCARCGFT